MYTKILFAIVFAVVANRSIAQTSRIFIANDDHTDYVWTASEEQYDSAFVRMLDYNLDQIDSTAGLPDNFQARFNCDAFYWLEAYKKARSKTQVGRLVQAIRSGHISVPLTYLVNTYGAQPTEAVIRGMFPAGSAQREYGLAFRLAVAMENQTLPLGLASLWSGAGARYSWRGICGCASRIPREPLAHRQHELYRYSGQDNAGVVMKWYNHGEGNVIPGGYAEARGVMKTANPLAEISSVVDGLQRFCNKLSPSTCNSKRIAGAFGYGWDDLETYVTPDFINAARNASNDSVTVRVSNEEDFFAAVDSSCGTLPVESVSYGNEWDLYSASMNETTARVRRALEKLRTAEALSSIVSLHRSNFGRGLADLRNAAWRSYGAYWEHDWTADGPVSRKDRAAWQIRQANAIADYSDTLLSTGAKELATMISGNPGTDFYVFNPLSWQRDDFADLQYTGPLPISVVDKKTHKDITSQIIERQGVRFIRIWAESIPALGYKLFSIQHGQPKTAPDAAAIYDSLVENDRFSLKFARSGALVSWKDKKTGRQLVKQVGGRFVNDIGESGVNAKADITPENRGPVSVTIRTASKYPVAHVSRITVYAKNNRIDIEDSINQNFGDVKTWAFSFNLTVPATHHEEVGAILLADKKSAGGDYADKNCRYDWQTFNHFADMSEANFGITLSNVDCSFFKLGDSSPDTLFSHATQLHALAGGQVDRYLGNKDSVILGMYDQQGQKNFSYRFALQAHAGPFDASQAMKFSLEHQNPLLARPIEKKGNEYPGEFSLLRTVDPKVLIWSVKPSEEGINNGLIVRSWNLQPASANASLSTGVKLASVQQTSHLESNPRPIALKNNRFDLLANPWQLVTFRLMPQFRPTSAL